MTLPVPNLDDRRFQDLVDDAKRMVQQRCPEWTDHNVSDPGVTLIETFAFMVDQLLYRLNRVPELNYLKFLDLIGVRLFPPTPAKAAITFWLSAPQRATVLVPAGTEVATLRTEANEAISFETVDDLEIVATSLEFVASTVQAGAFRQHRPALESGRPFFCFDQVPKPDDALLVGLSSAAPRNAVALRFDCQVEGVGVDPTNPPLAWEAWAGEEWMACEVEADETGGLNRPGDVVLHLPRGHETSVIDGQAAGWVRCRVLPAQEGQPTYSASPQINGLSVFSIGGTTDAVHAEEIVGEVLGPAQGVPGQEFMLQHSPVVATSEPAVLETAGPEGWEEWTAVGSFAESGPDDRHFVLDAGQGRVELGPAVREGDGTLRHYGAVPPKGAAVRLRSYRSGGGRHGNVAKGSINVLKTSIPYVSRIENRQPAIGGVDGESVDSAKVRAPILLRTRGRAVTTEDFEQLAREAAPEVARVRCMLTGEGTPQAAVRVLIVPAAPETELGELRFEDLVPDDRTLAQVASYLDERRVLGTRVIVEPPMYQGVTVVARLIPRDRTSPARLHDEAMAALYGYFHPLRGGPDGTGWPFGRPVQAGEIYAVLQRVRGVELVEDALLFGADPITGARGDPAQRLGVPGSALVFSYRHQLMVTGA
ncbi:MAG: hypothetical protein QOJ09_1875 [Actinomycetota bacterium]|nr:hypothetical protein [Actinomycetota bacterium]